VVTQVQIELVLGGLEAIPLHRGELELLHGRGGAADDLHVPGQVKVLAKLNSQMTKNWS